MPDAPINKPTTTQEKIDEVLSLPEDQIVQRFAYHPICKILETLSSEANSAVLKECLASSGQGGKVLATLTQKSRSAGSWAKALKDVWALKHDMPMESFLHRIFSYIPKDSAIFAQNAFNIEDRKKVIVELLEANNFERAQELIKQSLKLFPDDGALYYQLLLASDSLGKKDEALEAAKKALKFTSDTSSDMVTSIRGHVKRLGGTLDDDGKNNISDVPPSVVENRPLDEFGVTPPSLKTMKIEDLIGQGNVQLFECIREIEEKIRTEKAEVGNLAAAGKSDFRIRFIEVMEDDLKALKTYLEAREQAIANGKHEVRDADNTATNSRNVEVMSILNYNPEGDFNSKYGVPVPGVVFMNNPKKLADLGMEELMSLFTEKKKVLVSETLSEDYKLSVECLKKYIDARIKLNKKLLVLAEAEVHENEIEEEMARKAQEEENERKVLEDKIAKEKEDAARRAKEEEEALEQIGMAIEAEKDNENEIFMIATLGQEEEMQTLEAKIAKEKEEERIRLEAEAAEEAAITTDKHGIDVPNFKTISRKLVADASLKNLEHIQEDLLYEIRKLRRLETLTFEDEIKLEMLKEDSDMLEEYYDKRLDAEPRDISDKKGDSGAGAEFFSDAPQERPTPDISSQPVPFRPSILEDLTGEVMEEPEGVDETMANVFGIDDSAKQEHKSDVPLPMFDALHSQPLADFDIPELEEIYEHYSRILADKKAEQDSDDEEYINDLEGDLEELKKHIAKRKELEPEVSTHTVGTPPPLPKRRDTDDLPDVDLGELLEMDTEGETDKPGPLITCNDCSTVYETKFSFCTCCGAHNPKHENIEKYIKGSRDNINAGLGAKDKQEIAPESVEKPKKIKLIILGKNGEVIKDQIFETDIIKIGKISYKNFPLDSSKDHLSIDDENVNRMHARIEQRGGVITITDFGLAGIGTSVNGVKISRSSLKSGDIIQIGKTKIVFELPVEKSEGSSGDSYMPADDLIYDEESADEQKPEDNIEQAEITEKISMVEMGETLTVKSGSHVKLEMALSGDSIKIQGKGILTIGMLNAGVKIYMEKGATLIIEKASQKCDGNPVEVVIEGNAQDKNPIIFKEGVSEDCISPLYIG